MQENQIKTSSWWQKPSNAKDTNEHRAVSTIELFCDLVFVAYVASITHGLAADFGLHGMANFIVLFTIGWIIWFNSAMYHDVHGNNDFKTRVMTFLQMICIGFMSVFSHDVLDHSYVGYAVSLSAIVFVLASLWRETGIVDPGHKVYSKPYSTMYYMVSIFLMVSVFLPHQDRIIYLIVTMFFLITPTLTNYFFASEEIKKDYLERVKLSTAFIERSNLYFIIVLGEIVIGSLNGFSGHHMSLESILTLIFSFLVAFGLWFNHFEFVGHIQHRDTVGGYFMWLFSFYLEAMTVASLGGMIYVNYERFSINNMLIPTIVFFIATLIHFGFNKKLKNPNINVDTSNTAGYMGISLIMLVVTYFISNSILQTLTYLLALYIPVMFGVVKWIQGSRSLNQIESK